jgi:hypothetical protein
MSESNSTINKKSDANQAVTGEVAVGLDPKMAEISGRAVVMICWNCGARNIAYTDPFTCWNCGAVNVF